MVRVHRTRLWFDELAPPRLEAQASRGEAHSARASFSLKMRTTILHTAACAPPMPPAGYSGAIPATAHEEAHEAILTQSERAHRLFAGVTGSDLFLGLVRDKLADLLGGGSSEAGPAEDPSAMKRLPFLRSLAANSGLLGVAVVVTCGIGPGETVQSAFLFTTQAHIDPRGDISRLPERAVARKEPFPMRLFSSSAVTVGVHEWRVIVRHSTRARESGTSTTSSGLPGIKRARTGVVARRPAGAG